MKKKVILMSLLSVVMCMSLIVGATFALFTSESKVNIAVSSGSVNVQASFNDVIELYSKDVPQTGTFANGGTATTDGRELILKGLTPGDKAKLIIDVENSGSVAALYRAKAQCEGDTTLYSGLNIVFDGSWEKLPVGENAQIAVSVELPESAGNKYQGLETRIAFIVEAVQGNANVENETFVQATDDAKANGALLQEAVKNAKEGQTVYFSSGVYDLSRAEDVVEGQTGWYLPITQNGVTLVGIGNAVLTSTEVSINGSLNTQNFITIFGDDVTLDGFVVKCKMNANKAIQVNGANSVLKNLSLECNDILSYEDYLEQFGIEAGSATDYWEGYHELFAGSILYVGDIGNAVMENVYVEKAWISTTPGEGLYSSGTISAKNVVIDFVGSWYSGEPGYSAVSPNAKDVFTEVDGFTVKIDDSYTDIHALVDSIPEGGTIELAAGEYKVDNGETNGALQHNLLIDRDNITIEGLPGATVTADFMSKNGNCQQTILIKGDNVTLRGLTVHEINGYPNKTIEIMGGANALIEDCTVYSTSSAIYVGDPGAVGYTIRNNKIMGGCICITNGAGGAAGETSGVITGNTVNGSVYLNGLGQRDSSYAWMLYDLTNLPVIEGNDFAAPQSESGMLFYLRSLSFKESGTTAQPITGMGPMTMVPQAYVDEFAANNTFAGLEGFSYMLYPGNDNFAYFGIIEVQAGEDAAQNGAALANMLGKVEEGSVVYLAEGEYSFAESDSFELSVPGVTLVGKEGTVLKNMIGVSAEGVTLENITVSVSMDGKSEYVAPVYTAGQDITLSNCTIIRETEAAQPYGMLVNAGAGTIFANKCKFVAPFDPAAAFNASPSVFHAEGGLYLDSCTVATDGYGIFAQHVTKGEIKDTVFTGIDGRPTLGCVNSTVLKGLVFDGCTFVMGENSNVLAGSFTFRNCTFDLTQAPEGGAGNGINIYAQTGKVVIEDNTFLLAEGKTGINYTSAIWASGDHDATQVTVTGNTFEGTGATAVKVSALWTGFDEAAFETNNTLNGNAMVVLQA